MSQFSIRLQALRESRGWSQDRLAQILGISRSAIGNYEQGIRRPDFETLEGIADIFNVPMGYLLEEKGVISPETMVVFEMLNNDRTRDNLIKYAELLRDAVNIEGK